MYKLCALHVDEMEIKKQIQYDRNTKKLYGFTDVGSGIIINWFAYFYENWGVYCKFFVNRMI